MSEQSEVQLEDMEMEKSAAGALQPPHGDAAPEEDTPRSSNDLEAVFDIPVTVSAVLGKTYLEVSQLMKLGPGTIIELDRKVGEAIDIFVNNRLVARGEVVVIEERLGVTMTEIIKGDSV